MSKSIALVLMVAVSGVSLLACQSERKVQASREENQPLPSSSANQKTSAQPIKGELARVNLTNKTFAVRMENGVEQTFRFNDQTVVTGAPPASGRQKPASTDQMRILVGKEGSEISVGWMPSGSEKVATSVDIVQIITGRPEGNSRRLGREY